MFKHTCFSFGLRAERIVDNFVWSRYIRLHRFPVRTDRKISQSAVLHLSDILRLLTRQNSMNGTAFQQYSAK